MEAVTQSSLALPRHFRHLARLFSAAALFLTPFVRGGRACGFPRLQQHAKPRGVAIGYRAQDGWVSEGWWQVPSSTCATLIEGELQSRYYYLYAEDAAHGGRWTGDVNMCVAENEFKIAGVDDCYARSFQRMGFKEYDTGRQGSWMVQLSDTPCTQGNQN